MKRMIKGSGRLLVACLFVMKALATPNLTFIENKGQWSNPFDLVARVPGGWMGVQAGTFTYTLIDQQELNQRHVHRGKADREDWRDSRFLNGHVVVASFIGSNRNSQGEPFGEWPQYYNYFLGSDATAWHSHVRAFAGTNYPLLYPGIDLKVYADGTHLKYDFIIEAGADPSVIRWRYAGAGMTLTRDGNLVVNTTLADLIEQKPVAYQWIDGEKKFVTAAYQLTDDEVSFALGPYDRCYPLVIDPLLIFSTYSGSTADNWGSTATPGEHGTLYSSGVTNLFNVGGTFPATAGAFQTVWGGNYDVAVLKYDSTGHQLLYATYLGGTFSESPHSLVMDKDENLLILGTTSSANFPTSAGAFRRTFAGGVSLFQTANREIPIPYENGSDIFVVKLSKDGSQLLASTYLGGSANDGLNPSLGLLVQNYGDQMRGDITSDANGNIFVSSVTSSPDFPVAHGFSSTFHGGQTDALILKLSGDLSQIIWGTFLGGQAEDASHTIRIDHNGDLFVAGGTASANFPTTPGVYQPTFGGTVDGWIAKIKGDGSALQSATYTGTSQFNEVYFLDLDKNENVYVYGQTVGTFPVTTGVYNNPNSGQFLQKFDNSLSSLLFSTVFGSGIGIPNISPTAFLVSDCNNIYLSGWGGEINSNLGYWNSSTQQMPVTSNALQKTTSGSDFYFMVLSADASQLLYATYLGGVDSRTHLDGGTCRFDKAGVVYHAVCSGCQAFNAANHATSDFPTTVNAWSRVNGSGNCNNAAFKFDLASLRAVIQTNSTHLNQPGLNRVCLNDKIVFQNLSIGGQTYAWNLGDGTKVTKPDTTLIVYQFKTPGVYTVRLKVVDNGTCAVTDSTRTTIQVYAPQGSAGPNQSICFHSVTTLTASGGAGYQWVSTDKTFSSAQENPTVSPLKDTRYLLTITDGNGCITHDTVTVTVVPGLDLPFKTEQVFGCEGRPSVIAVNQADPQIDSFFDFGDGNISDQRQATHQYSRDGQYTISLVGKNQFCTYENTVSLPFYYRLVPNVFTPGQSPGLNDTFMVQYGANKPLPGMGLPVKISLAIYDRWGKLIYQNQDYKNDWGAEHVAGGVYYFEATLEGESTCKGWVDILK